MAESSQQPRDDVDEEEERRKENAKKAYVRLQSMAVALGTQDTSRVACRLSRWSNPLHIINFFPLHMQWKEVNDAVTTDMVKEIWPIIDANASKGQW